MESDPLALVLIASVAMVFFMAVLWGLQLRLRNASIADVGWCIGLIATVFWYVAQAPGDRDRKLAVAVMASMYAGRLGLYILTDRVIGKEEDARYRRLRERWGLAEGWALLGYFELQALAVSAFSLPFLVIIQNPGRLSDRPNLSAC